MTRRVLIETYGCQMNVADSELMQGILSDSGFEAAEALADADVILLNTCAVREKAEERIIGRLSNLLPLKRARPELVLGVTGCMAEHLRERLLEQVPYIDLIVGPDSYRRLPALIDEAAHDPIVDVRLDRREVYDGLTPAHAEGVCGWITIQRGCDKFCTFCIVPFVRGRERAVAPREVLRQAQQLAESGVSTVTLLGQTVNSYSHEEVDFSDLLRAVASVDGIERVRFTSPYPRDFTPKLIATIAEVPEVCPFLHLPLQSGSDRVLEAMRRQHTVADYLGLVGRLRAAVPEVALSTDIIVGFPGETEADYAATVQVLQDVRFDSAFMFAYSEREGTHASRKLPDDVDEVTKKRRLAAIIELQQTISTQTYGARVGRRVAVMAEGYARRDAGDLVGNTADFKTTVFNGQGYRPGDLVEVEVVGTTSHTLLGRPTRLLKPSRKLVDLFSTLAPGVSIGAST